MLRACARETPELLRGLDLSLLQRARRPLFEISDSSLMVLERTTPLEGGMPSRFSVTLAIPRIQIKPAQHRSFPSEQQATTTIHIL